MVESSFRVHIQTKGSNGRYLSGNEVPGSTSLIREYAIVFFIAFNIAWWKYYRPDDDDKNGIRVAMEVGILIISTWFSSRLLSAYEREAQPGFGLLGNTFLMVFRFFSRRIVKGGQREAQWLQDESDPRLEGHIANFRDAIGKMGDMMPKQDVEKVEEIGVKTRDGTVINVSIVFPAKQSKAVDQDENVEEKSNDSYSLPSLAFFCHGGAFVATSPAEPIARQVANSLNAVVVAPQYRLAPEHKFPTAHNDCVDAFEAVVRLIEGQQKAQEEETSLLKGICDLSKIAILGESAGGNLATHLAFSLSRPTSSSTNGSVSIHPTTLRLPPKANLKALLLFCPVVTPYSPTASHVRLTRAPIIGDATITWMWNRYLKDPLVDSYNPTVNLLLDDNVNFNNSSGDDTNVMPSTVIVTGWFDPLCDEGENLAKYLASKMSTTSQSHNQQKQTSKVYAARRLEAHCMYHPTTTNWVFKVGKALLNDEDVPEDPPQ